MGAWLMKTTLEIPDAIFRRAKTVAAERGIPFRALVSEALSDKLRAQRDRDSKPWMKTFGKLRHLHKETARINRIMEEEFDQVETEDQQCSWTPMDCQPSRMVMRRWSRSFAKPRGRRSGNCVGRIPIWNSAITRSATLRTMVNRNDLQLPSTRCG